jgi:hypothetical protein
MGLGRLKSLLFNEVKSEEKWDVNANSQLKSSSLPKLRDRKKVVRL